MASLLGGFAGLGGGSIGRASVDLVLNAASYQSQLAAAEGETSAATNKMGQGFAGFQQKVKESFSGAQIAAVGFGAVAAVGIAKAVGATQQWTQEVYNLQKVTGQSAQDASRLASTADTLGVSSDKLTIGLGLLSKNIVNGSANLTKYGVATTDASGATLPFTTILANLSDKFNGLQVGAQQTAFAVNVFGRSGRSLIPILQEGSAKLQELYAQVPPGLVLTQQQVDANRQLAISERDLGESLKGIEVQIGNAFVPMLTQLVKDLTGFADLVGKIPAPIAATTLAFIALNGALVAARGIWGVTTKMIQENAAALGLHTAATEADTAATEQAGVATKVLNSNLAASVPQLIALSIATEHAVTEWEAVKSGDWAGALNTVTSAAGDFGLQIGKVTVVSSNFADGLKQVQAGLADGSLSADQATTAVQDLATKYGVTLPQAVYDSIRAQAAQSLATKQGGVAAQSAAAHQSFLASETRQAAEASAKHADALRAEKIAEAQLAGGLVGLIGDQEALNQAQAKVNQLRDNGKQGTLAYHDAVTTLITSQQQLNQDLHTQVQEMRQQGVPLADIKNRLEGIGKQAGATKAEVDNWISGMKGAKGLLDDITSKTHVVNVQVNVSQVGVGLPPAIQQELQRLLAKGF